MRSIPLNFIIHEGAVKCRPFHDVLQIIVPIQLFLYVEITKGGAFCTALIEYYHV